MKTLKQFLKEDTFDANDFVELIKKEFLKFNKIRDPKKGLQSKMVGPETFKLTYDFNSESYWENKIKLLNYDTNNVKIYSSGESFYGKPYNSVQYNSIADYIKRISTFEIFYEG